MPSRHFDGAAGAPAFADGTSSPWTLSRTDGALAKQASPAQGRARRRRERLLTDLQAALPLAGLAVVSDEAIAQSVDRLGLNDIGLGSRLVLHFGDELIYCPAWGFWLFWDGRRWRKDDRLHAQRRAKEVLRLLFKEAAMREDPADSRAVAEFALSRQTVDAQGKTLKAAQSDLVRQPDEFDQDPWLLNVNNGTVDLRTGELRPHQRADLITKLAPFDYDPHASAPTFLAFLDQIMAGSQDTIAFLQRALGLSCSGITDRAFFTLYGTGANGKSTLLELVRQVLGDYATRTSTETIMVKRGGGSSIPNDLAALVGARFVTTSESEEGETLAVARINDLTGGEAITARFMRGEFFTYKPAFKVWFGTNHKPNIRATTHGIWDRMKLIPFTVRIEPQDQDKALPAKLLAEASGVLAWMVQGALGYQSQGLGQAPEVLAATQSYRDEQDVIREFLESLFVTDDPTARVAVSEVFDAYRGWCQVNNERMLTQRNLGRRIEEHGFERVKGTGGVRMWAGIGRPKPAAFEPPDDERGWE